MSKAKQGEPLSNEQVLRMAVLFKDELTLANIPRPLLVTMCRYMQLNVYGSDSFLRYQVTQTRVNCNEVNNDYYDNIDEMNDAYNDDDDDDDDDNNDNGDDHHDVNE